MRTALSVLIVWLAAAPASAQSRADLAGRWERDVNPGPGMEDTFPSWERIAFVDGAVEIVRSTRPTQVERYSTDDSERTTVRVRGGRACRASWTGEQLVLTCRDAAEAPGGGAQPILTREVRYIDTAGHLHLDLTWRSGDEAVTKSTTYHRAQGANVGGVR